MSGWSWIDAALLWAAHDEQLLELGGAPDTRDTGPLEPAGARARKLAHHETADGADLAAACAFGIARNRPRVDGNARTTLDAAELFLALNGLALQADGGACVVSMHAVAAGQMDESALARALGEHGALITRPRGEAVPAPRAGASGLGTSPTVCAQH
jgi:death-on-curing protein